MLLNLMLYGGKSVFEKIKKGDSVMMVTKLFPFDEISREVIISRLTAASIFVENDKARFRRKDGMLVPGEMYPTPGSRRLEVKS